MTPREEGGPPGPVDVGVGTEEEGTKGFSFGSGRGRGSDDGSFSTGSHTPLVFRTPQCGDPETRSQRRRHCAFTGTKFRLSPVQCNTLGGRVDLSLTAPDGVGETPVSNLFGSRTGSQWVGPPRLDPGLGR